jgi:PKD repeat protein
MRSRVFSLAISLLILIVLEAKGNTLVGEFLESRPVVLDKPDEIISQGAIDYMKARNAEMAKIWVFFNDKAVFDARDFEQASAAVKISDHTRERREKMGLTNIVFADLPVNRDYINRIIGLGGELRRTSRWLNAASFEASYSILNEIAALSFVHRIQPVVGYKSVREIVPDNAPPAPKFSLEEADVLDYGYSWTQMYMINAHELHVMGYSGESVVVAMLDAGYRKSHQAFALATGEGRLLGEYDFIFDDNETQNEPEDHPDQHNHGTYCWSTLGGYSPGQLIGPAYGASFLLAKTEDIRSETPVEEDNWVAALEWADSLGADVISASLSYGDWYTYEDLDGNTAVTTLAANTAASLGIVICNSMGNEGPAPGTLRAPSDAFNILACGAVNAAGTIVFSSSRGPSADGRIKPEVCAMGQGTYCASADTDYGYAYKNGTSFSTPLVGGATAVLLSAHPDWTPYQVRQALMQTASRGTFPDNNYGWGIIDMLKAFNWGANFYSDTTWGFVPLTVQFYDSSTPPADYWKWYFGDGDSSATQNPIHIYTEPGSYDVSLMTNSYGMISRTEKYYILAIADTLDFISAAARAGDTAVMSINLRNTQELNSIIIPVLYSSPFDICPVEISRGERTQDFGSPVEIFRDDVAGELVFALTADGGGGNPKLESGEGEIAKLYFEIGTDAQCGQSSAVDTSIIGSHAIRLSNSNVAYSPYVRDGEVIVETDLRGDADNSGGHDMLDILFLVNYLYKGGPEPVTLRAGDANADGNVNMLDILYLIAYLYKGGPPPPQ